MDPVLPKDRTWTSWDYIAYWVSDATNAATWQLASSMLAVGLSWRQALSAIAVGNIIIAVGLFLSILATSFSLFFPLLLATQTVMVLNGTIGARLHIAFPVLNRSSFGFWLSYFSVISRVVLAMFWFGVQVGVLAFDCKCISIQDGHDRHLQVLNVFIKC
jgi:cytosine/uracil/thiamine/allantoin permease